MYHSLSQLSNQVIESCPSTNDLAKELAESGYPHGTWIPARMQTAGKGRLGRAWISPVGNLYLSILVRPQMGGGHANIQWTSWVPLTTAVATVQYLKSAYPLHPLQIKWPNDLWLGGRKCGGILCEALGNSTPGGAAIIIGIGLNCAFAPDIPDAPVTSLSLQAEQADSIRLPLIAAVVKEVDYLFQKGPQRISELYSQLAVLTPGKPIHWSSEGMVKRGKVLGLGPSGELIVIEDNGGQKSLYAEDIKISF